MNNFPSRALSAPPGGAALNAAGRGAALLIDFDNVTMNVRSDLGKELKSLLDSDVFRGKIAVRRAYADWRRYPASVVPLTEASVDLIFAPAYGTSKKNATDLRMAVDAIELAFMRPEIGVFILLTGDSDFSSCVMKLKEYGKYVIGVGMRESASDLLIQNCDEYYSYHNLSGLTRATEDTGVREDPWELVGKAVQMMARRGDVMRVDRLKQVMVDLDPGFSEKDLGYGKFSRFITEAQQKGLVRLRKTDQGDWEVMPGRAAEGADGASAAEPRGEPRADRGERDRGDRGRRGRGRFGDRFRDRDRDRPRVDAPSPIEVVVDLEEPAAAEAPAMPPVFGEPEVQAPPAAEAPAFEAPASEAPASEAPAPGTPAQPAAAAAPAEPVDPLRNAYALLQHTLRQMVRRPGEVARDGDLKRRMLELQPGFDEHALGFSKFNRFLRQAHDAEVVDVRRTEDGGYEVLLPASGRRLPEPVLTAGAAAPQAQAAGAEAPAAGAASADGAGAERGGRGGRGRGRRGAPSGPPPLLPGQVAAPAAMAADTAAAPAEAPSARAEEPAAAPQADPREPEMTPAQALQEREDGMLIQHREPAVVTARLEDPASIANRGSSTTAGSVGVRGRGARGRRGGVPSGPPPLLPGQVINIGGTRAEEPAPPAAAAAEPPRAEALAAQPERARGEAPVADARPAPAGFDPAAYGLPTDRDGIVARIASYNFVGRATGEALADAYGAEVWRTLDENPDAVAELIGKRKARPLLEQWGTERSQLQPVAAPEAPAAADEAPAADDATPAEAEVVAGDADPTLMGDATVPEGGGRSRARRGRGRGRGRTDADESAPAQAEAVIGDTDPTRVGGAGTGAAPAGEDVPSAAAQAEAVVGDTDPTLMGDAVADAAGGDEPRGRRGRRGGRGRGRGRAGGDAGADAGDAPAEAAAPAPAPEAAPAEEVAPAGDDRPARRGRGGRGRARGGAEADPAPAADAAPAPEAAPAVNTEPAGGRGRGRRGGRGAAPAADAAAPAPATPPAPAVEAAGTDDAASGARGRSRRRGGRGRGGNRGRTGGAPE